jgi:hypothetical protein
MQKPKVQKNKTAEANKPKISQTAKATDGEENKKRPFYLDAPRGKGKSKAKGKRR